MSSSLIFISTLEGVDSFDSFLALEKLRFIDGWSRQQLADHYQKRNGSKSDGHTKIDFYFSDSGSFHWPATKSIKGSESRSIATHKRFSGVQMGNADVATD
jgi:hypothetical protein